MSLYDGLGIGDSRDEGKGEPKSDVSGWSSGFKLLHSQVQAKKKALQSGVSKPKRGTNTLAPVIDLKRQRDDPEVHFNLQTGRIERIAMASLPIVAGPFIGSEPPHMMTSLLGVTDEYDPLRPNDYESFIKKRKEIRQREREEERQRKGNKDNNRVRRHRRRSDSEEEEENNEESEFDRRKRQREEEEEEFERPTATTRPGGAAIAPPPSLVEEGSATPGSSQPPDDDTFESPGLELSPPRVPGVSFGMSSVASKIMAKYGYKKGQGLGKKEQGMSTALFVEKTSKRGGKIIHEKDIPKNMPPPMEAPRMLPQTNADLLKNPSKVILLRNMVGPGEVDDDLEPETAEECTKYGKVIKCVIFEMPNAIEEEAVRIFMEFERIESGIKAIVDLNGRFFGGRVVKACFYNHDMFRRLELAEEML